MQYVCKQNMRTNVTFSMAKYRVSNVKIPTINWQTIK